MYTTSEGKLTNGRYSAGSAIASAGASALISVVQRSATLSHSLDRRSSLTLDWRSDVLGLLDLDASARCRRKGERISSSSGG